MKPISLRHDYAIVYTYSDSLVLIRSKAVRVILLLLDDLGLVQGLDCHLFIFNKESKSTLPI